MQQELLRNFALHEKWSSVIEPLKELVRLVESQKGALNKLRRALQLFKESMDSSFELKDLKTFQPHQDELMSYFAQISRAFDDVKAEQNRLTSPPKLETKMLPLPDEGPTMG